MRKIFNVKSNKPFKFFGIRFDELLNMVVLA